VARVRAKLKMAIMAILHCFQTIRAKSGQNQGKKKGYFALISDYIIPIFRLFSFFRANGQKKTIEKMKKNIYRERESEGGQNIFSYKK